MGDSYSATTLKETDIERLANGDTNAFSDAFYHARPKWIV
jgi:hypothetical protein